MGYYAKRFFGKKIEEPRDPDFVITVDCRNRTVFEFYLREGPKDVVIDWGNGQITESTSDAEENIGINYSIPARGIYQIRIKGSFPGFYPYPSSAGQILSLDQWGTNEFTTMEGMFEGAENMEANYTDRPNTSNVTSMHRMFSGCSKFNGEVNFNTSNVTTMNNMFRNCTEFNQEVNFNTSNVTNMQSVFYNCAKFNQEVDFDTQNVTTMHSMFRDCAKFNQEVDFDTQNVTTMYAMFYQCTELVIPVKLDISSVTDISYMFRGRVPRQSFASWDVTSLTAGLYFINEADMNESGNTDNYDNTLISWASQDIQRASSLLTIDFGSSKYSSRAKSARDFFVSKNWRVRDGGMI